MTPTERKDTQPHSHEHPPGPAPEAEEQKLEFEFVFVRPDRPGRVGAAMAKRPIER